MPAYCTRKLIIEIAGLLQIALFVYTAANKLLDYENFNVQLGQSPMLSAFAGLLAYGVPAAELAIALLIAIPATRLAGLCAAFCLMVMFSAYIYIIINYGSYVPCSCGGVLEKLGWREHLFFNLFFVGMLALAIALELWHRRSGTAVNRVRLGVHIGGMATLSAMAVLALYLWSEDIMHHRNNFVRRFPAFAEPESRKHNLESSSYYFAGIDGSTIYLGNSLAPRVVVAIDTTFKKVRKIVIELDRMDLPFASVQVRVAPPFFYLIDGTVPCIFKGTVDNWQGSLLKPPPAAFTHAEPVGPTRFAVKAIRPDFKASVGLLDCGDTSKIVWKKGLLLSDGDGIFDVDGQLFRNGLTPQFHYIHFYRNEFFTTDTTLQLVRRAHTIDTVSRSSLKVANLRGRGERKLSAPALTVNRTASAYDNLLFVNSQLIGKHEDEQMWKHASVIDAYDLNDNSYCSSMYLYHVDKNPMRSFIAVGNTIYALSGTWLSAVPLPHSLTARYSSNFQGSKKDNLKKQ